MLLEPSETLGMTQIEGMPSHSICSLHRCGFCVGLIEFLCALCRLLLFQFLLPALEVVVFCFAIGRNLEGIGLVLVNQDNHTCTYVRPCVCVKNADYCIPPLKLVYVG